MQRRLFLHHSAAAFAAAGLAVNARAASDIVVIGAEGLPPIDAALVHRLYMGRAIEIAGAPVTVAQLTAGSPVRARFLSDWLQSDEERYRAYWTVRRHIGKGAPPQEIDSEARMIEFVQRTPGAVGYVSAAALKPSVRVIARLP
jgi:GrpB-like predicted nucleotidyltransferase (UPF0157 family)